MTIKDIFEIYTKAAVNIYAGKISGAFLFAKKMIKSLNNWDLQREYDELSTIYRNMLSYKINNPTQDADVSQDEIYHQLIINLFQLITKLRNDLLRRDTKMFEPEGEAILEANPKAMFNSTVEEFEQLPFLLQTASLMNSNQTTEDIDYAKAEKLQNEYQQTISVLFAYTLLRPKLTQTELFVVESIIKDDRIAIEMRCVALTALTMNALRTFDRQKIYLIIDLCQSSELMIRQRAIVGFVLLLAKFGKILDLDKNIREKTENMAQDEELLKDLQNTVFQILRTTETGQITRHINEDIMPELQKMSPKIKEKLDEIDPDDEDKIIPKLNDIMDGSDISDKLSEFADLQMSGSDVYASTFAQMKHFPFFKWIENWFTPFNTHNPHFARFGGKRRKILDIISQNPMLCHSDKYSLAFNLLQAPEAQIDAIESAISQESSQIKEMVSDINKKEMFSEKNQISNHYILDLYRFYVYFPRRQELDNPLVRVTMIMSSDIAFRLFSTEDQQIAIAGYLYQYNLYLPAVQLYKNIISKNTNPSVEIYRNVAYAYQHIADYANAIKYYILAETLDKHNMWYQRRMAYCYRQIGDFGNAIACYRRVLESNEEDFRVMFRLANCYIQSKQYAEALTILHKINYLKPDYPKLQSTMLEALWADDKIEQARLWAEKYNDRWNTVEEFALIGHIYMASKERSKAIDSYKKSVENAKKLGEYLSIVYQTKDIAILQQNGVLKSELDIVLEFVLMDNFK